jgi:hypothetical protein
MWKNLRTDPCPLPNLQIYSGSNCQLSRILSYDLDKDREFNNRMKKRRIVVNDEMQSDYVYFCTEPIGKNFHSDFRPELTPRQMLKLGVFGGKYMTDCAAEFPDSWFSQAKLCRERHDPRINCFGVNASQPLSVWRKKGWIYHEDPRGWFQWYCRYYMGRRCPDDVRQIKRWRAMRRHIAQIQKNCPRGETECRPRQRQALLQWAYDSRKI